MKSSLCWAALLFFGACASRTPDSDRSVATEAPESLVNADTLLRLPKCWPLMANRRDIHLFNPQSLTLEGQFRDFDPEVICFPFSLRAHFNFHPEQSADLGTPTPGLIYLLTNAHYLYSPPQFRDLALSLNRDGAGGRSEPVFGRVHIIDNLDRDTQAVVLETDTHYVVIFQGTTSSMDWIFNLETTPYFPDPRQVWNYYHKGFWENYAVVDAQIRGILRANPGKKVVVTGHSLGGALANIFLARSLKENGFFPASRIQSVVTWASPRIASRPLAREIETLARQAGIPILRIANAGDLVPHLPPLFLGFRSIGKSTWRQPSGGLWMNTVDDDHPGFMRRPMELLDMARFHMGMSYFEFHRKELFEMYRLAPGER